ncbi:D-alanine--D-alanine ligase [uncultured Polaribacter sp.]|uniref:D-alanine--D-alanine ligase n=1 Tax=uncultured Polaribacter sp. TaxID=174711 RepID=UPI000EB8A1EF|nr:D-alanine--D-alanine ligase [Polaribacter sp.]|tara:strand:+ start:4122 stop:5099 length:978 start_codon:yes stop_codon:yes gene_type:complete
MKKNIAIIMGGYSTEVNISIKSGNVVYDHLDREKYMPYRILISEEKWVALDALDTEYSVDKNDFSFVLKGKKILFDCVFNAIHGTPGEDGALLAYLNLIQLKHTSAPFYQMALTFNKRDTLSVVQAYGIKTATAVYLNKGDAIDLDAIISKVGLPCFIKPNKAGSSFGISKAHTKETILPAITIAFKEDTEILIESFLEGTEVSVGIISFEGITKVLPITEIVSENDFFDYEAKYNGKSEEITPARITEKQQEKVKKAAKKIYEILNLTGISRSEFIFVNDEPYFLEINMVPGLTAESILPQQALAAGISLQSLFGNAITTALKK